MTSATDIKRLTLAGRSKRTKQLAEMFGVSADAVDRLDAFQWAMLNQASAALISQDVWRYGRGANVEEFALELLKKQSAYMESLTFSVFDSKTTLNFTLPGYEDPAYFVGFADPVDEGPWSHAAFKLLQQVEDWTWLSPVVGCVVITGQSSDFHISSSQRNMPGTIVSQEAYGAVHAAEIVVHEGGHSAFNLLLEGLGVMDSVLQLPSRYYSPWKGTERPAFGLLHAMFSFGRIELFRRKFDSARAQSDQADSMEKLSLAVGSVDECLNQLDSSELRLLFDGLVRDLGLR